MILECYCGMWLARIIGAVCGFRRLASYASYASSSQKSGRAAISTAFFAVFGIAFVVPEVIFGALLQRLISAETRGRVYSLVGLIAMAMNPAGMFLAVVALFIPGVRALNRHEGSATPEAAPALAGGENSAGG